MKIKSDSTPHIRRLRNKRITVLVLFLLVSGGLFAQNFGASPPSAISLSCDGKGSSPDNVSTYNPMLSWTFSDGDAGDAQSSYSIQVRRHDNGSVVWNLTNQNVSTSTRMYNGNPLQPNVLYDWSVQVWDRSPQASAVATASFTVLDIGLRAFDGTSIIKIATDKVNIAAPVTDANRLRISKGGTTYCVLLSETTAYGASKLQVQIPSGIKAYRMMVPPPPAVGLSPGYLVFSGAAGTNPGAQPVSVQNVGGGSLTGLTASVSYGTGSGWLGTSLPGTAPATLTVTPSAASLAAGIYTATVTVASSVAVNSPQAISVTLRLTLSVTYSGNGATGGTAPTDANGYLPGATVTVLGNSGNLVRTGYDFSGWNTLANGSGTTYTQGQTFLMGGSNTTLYAKWTAIPSTVSFNAQGGSAPSPASITVTYGSTYGTLATTNRTNYNFGGWWTGTGGTGTQILSTTTVTITANHTLYAKWTPSLPDLVVSAVTLQTTGPINAGDNVSFSYTVQNIGGEGPPGNSTFDVLPYFSADQVFDETDISFDWGYSVWTYHLSLSFNYTVPDDGPSPDTIPAGSYYLIVVVDALPGQPPNYYPGVAEMDEQNNWRASSNTVTIN